MIIIMECPHMSSLVAGTMKVQQLPAPPPSSAAANFQINNSNNTNNKVTSSSSQLFCSVCGSVSSPWFCCTCSLIHCGRYVNGHAKEHFETSSHSVSVDCYSLTPYCYSCDAWANPSLLPTNITKHLLLIQNNSGNIIKKTNTKRRSNGRRSRKKKKNTMGGGVSKTTSSSDLNEVKKRKLLDNSGEVVNSSIMENNNSELNEHCSSSSSNGSSISSTATTSNNKHGVVGLRNLGNTCFMNAVLQSLSKIRGFSCYISNQIPSPTTVYTTGGGITTENNGSPSTPLVPTTILSSEIIDNTSTAETLSSDHHQLNTTTTTRRLTRSRLQNYNSHSQQTIQPQLLVDVLVTGPGAELTTPDPTSSSVVEQLRREEHLTNELRKIVILLNTKGSSAVSPNSLFSIIWELMPKFRGYQQQDAHEFLRYMLDELHNELVRLVPKFSWKKNGKKNGGRTRGGGRRDDIDLNEYLLEEEESKSTISKGGSSRSRGSRRNCTSSSTSSLISAFGISNNKNGGLHLDNYYNNNYTDSGSIVTSMFGGVLENEVRCSGCGLESRKDDPFLDLSLDIPGHGGGSGSSSGGSSGEARLVDCLASFTDVEELSDNDKYYCSNCEAHQKSTKRFTIRRLPNVLCLHLKRFRWSNYLRTKLDQYVSFPMRSLDMSKYLLRRSSCGTSSCGTRGSTNSSLYDLSAVIVHHGTGVGSGHYTAFAKKDSQWYHFNDSAVKLSEESAVAKCKAYILFYTRPQFKI